MPATGLVASTFDRRRSNFFSQNIRSASRPNHAGRTRRNSPPLFTVYRGNAHRTKYSFASISRRGSMVAAVQPSVKLSSTTIITAIEHTFLLLFRPQTGAPLQLPQPLTLRLFSFFCSCFSCCNRPAFPTSIPRRYPSPGVS